MLVNRFFLYASVFGCLFAADMPAHAQAGTSYDSGSASQTIQMLQNQLEELQQENRRIAQSLAVSSAKALSVDQNEESFKAREREWQEKLSGLEQKIKDIETENAALKMRPSTPQDENEALASLRKKNAGLLKTVDQQNNMLETMLVYERLARQLKEENESLLEKLQKSALSGAVDIELEKENKKLREAVAKRDEFIKRMEILKVAAQALKADNEKLVAELARVRNSALPVAAAQNAPVQNNGQRVSKTPQAIEMEYKEMMVAYRKKIREYQEEVAQLHNQLAERSSSVDEAAAGGKEDEIKRKHKIAALQLENQELHARIKLLMERQNSLVFQDNGVVSSQGKGASPSEAGEDERAINIVSAKAEVKTSASALKTVAGNKADGEGVVYKMPPESLEMLRERGVLK